MLRAALRDLRWRMKRFVIATFGVSLVFAMGLVADGLSASFSVETERTMNAIGAQTWVVADTATGPFTSFSLMPAGKVVDPNASPVMLLPESISVGDGVDPVVVLAAQPGALGSPRATNGSDLAGRGEVIVDRSLHNIGVGDSFLLGGQAFRVVGTVSGQRLAGGVPMVYMSLADAQDMAVGGQPVVTAFLFSKSPGALPPGLKAMSSSEVKSDALRPLKNAISSISIVRLLLWLVAATIIGSVLYLQATERTRDFAVFKATGTSTTAIGSGLALQAVVLSLASAVLAAALAVALAPRFPLYVEIPTRALLLLPVVTVVVGLSSCLVTLRKIATIQPALAFGG